jgi:DNA-binding PucR family transcriptional regulator
MASGERQLAAFEGEDFSRLRLRPPQLALALAGGDRDRARDFVRTELGPLEAVGRARCGRLLATLEAFLEHGQRIVNASAASGQHRDTVHSHLREIERILDCRIEHRSAELLWALRLRRALDVDSAGEAGFAMR